MNPNRTLNTVLNGLSTAAIAYVVARVRGSDSPRRTALLWGIAGAAVAYVVLGRVDFDALEAEAEAAAETVVEADAGTGDASESKVVGSAVEHAMGWDEEGAEGAEGAETDDATA